MFLRQREVRHRALFQRRHLFADFARRVVLGAHHAHATDAGFRDLQKHHAGGHLLLRQIDVYRLITLGVIGCQQGIAGPLHIFHAALGAEKRCHGPFDGACIEHGIAAHDVFIDIDLRRCSFCTGSNGRRRLLRQHMALHAAPQNCQQCCHRLQLQTCLRACPILFNVMHSVQLSFNSVSKRLSESRSCRHCLAESTS